MSSKKINYLVDSVKLLIIIVIALTIVAAIIFSVSEEPWNALYNLFVGPFLSLRRIGNVIEGACPLIFTALAVMLIFGTGQFSMIAEGSFFIGCAAAMSFSLMLNMQTKLHMVLCVLFAAIAGAMVASIPALLKRKWNVSEVVTSIMLNYVVQYFAIYLVTYHFREKNASSVASLKLATTSLIPKMITGTNVHYGVLFAVALCVVCWLLIYRSRFGFEMRVTGCNQQFARYSGMKDGAVIVGSQIIAGGIAGAGGSVELLGMYSRFKWTTTPGYGWTGIVVALLAKDNPLMVPLSACFISYINVGANIMAMNSDVSNEVAQIIQSAIMMLIASGAMLQRWRQRLVVKAAEKEQALSQAAAGEGEK